MNAEAATSEEKEFTGKRSNPKTVTWISGLVAIVPVATATVLILQGDISKVWIYGSLLFAASVMAAARATVRSGTKVVLKNRNLHFYNGDKISGLISPTQVNRSRLEAERIELSGMGQEFLLRKRDFEDETWTRLHAAVARFLEDTSPILKKPGGDEPSASQ